MESNLKGVIKFYDTKKGFGFIKQENSEAEYFFHFTSLKDLIIAANDKVTFDVVPSKWKAGTFIAINIKKII